ncbi:transcriptional regulator [Sporosarcina sp. FSL K6-5500]|uniref:transcriptional regulator n=1 Tax=Sporosarcina sp. FSL K6-5500 TaxID=2921558 RepID=UPI0030FC0660
MTSTNTSKIVIQGTGNYEQTPAGLFDYVQLELISHTEYVVYVKLLQFYNLDLGYAYPTIPQLMFHTNIASKATIHRSLKTLEDVGLIQRARGSRGNNIYEVYKPLDKAILYSRVPAKVTELKEVEAKLLKTAVSDKERFKKYKMDSQEQQIDAL